jgi:hypothetical protein
VLLLDEPTTGSGQHHLAEDLLLGTGVVRSATIGHSRPRRHSNGGA